MGNFSRRLRRILVSSFLLVLVLQAPFFLTSCSTTTTGSVKENVTLTGETKKLKEEGLKYDGPLYNIAIITFANKTPGKVLGVGEDATDILRTIVKQAGLEPIVLSKGEMRQQEKLIELQQSGALKTGLKNAAEGFAPVDLRISGAVTSYAEYEESSDVLLAQTKTHVAKVQVDYALVDVATGETLVADSGVGEYKKETGGILGFGSKMTEDVSLRDGALRDALTKAMVEMIKKLNSLPFKSYVLAAADGSVTIRAGERSRLPIGTVLSVYRPGQNLIDPETGRVIGRSEKKIGEIALTSNQGLYISEASIKSGGGFKAGDIVRLNK